MSVGINPSKIYTHPVMGKALGKWVPLLTAVGNFYWHLAKTSPGFAAWRPKYDVYKAKRDAGEYLQADLSGGAKQALANVMLTAAPVSNPDQWLQDRLDAYAKDGKIFLGADPRFALSDWTVAGAAPAGGGSTSSGMTVAEGAGIGAGAIGVALLALAGYLEWKRRQR
jgi:hypothetical protein